MLALPVNLPGNVSCRGCRGKQRHRSQGAADAHARALVRLGMSERYHSYFCLLCRGWHAGKAHK